MVIIKKESIDDISYLSLPIFHSLAVARWEIVGIYNQRKTYLEYLIARLRTFSSDKHMLTYIFFKNSCFCLFNFLL